MSSEEIFDKVKEIIVEQLGVGEDSVNEESSFIEDLGADSLDIVELIMAIEEEFEASWVKLNVPYISQNKNDILNGCEAACMLMALQYKGYLKDMSLKEYVKLMPLSPDTDAEKVVTVGDVVDYIKDNI